MQTAGLTAWLLSAQQYIFITLVEEPPVLLSGLLTLCLDMKSPVNFQLNAGIKQGVSYSDLPTPLNP